MGILNFLKRNIFRSIEKQSSNESDEISALVSTIAQLTKEKESLTATMNRYWELYTDLKKELESGNQTSPDILPHMIRNYLSNHSIPYRIEEDELYVKLISEEEQSTISFRREFNKDNRNWVDKDYALITLAIDNFNYKLLNPTLVNAPVSGIFESNKNKSIRYGEEICRIKKYDSNKKVEIIEEIEKNAIKEAVLKKERKKMIERATLDELIAEGKVFNVVTSGSGKRLPIPVDIANAVWNRDGGQCRQCGSKKELEFDHIIPISKGGATSFRNLQLLCRRCNLVKSDKI